MNPPLVEVAVPHHGLVVVVQHGAQSTPELGIDELAGALPREVFVVQLVRLVEPVQILREVLGGREIFDVNVRVRRCRAGVVLFPAAHYDGNNVVSTTHITS